MTSYLQQRQTGTKNIFRATGLYSHERLLGPQIVDKRPER